MQPVRAVLNKWETAILYLLRSSAQGSGGKMRARHIPRMEEATQSWEQEPI